MKNVIVIVVLLILVYVVASGNMPSLVELGHAIAKHIFPPVKQP